MILTPILTIIAIVSVMFGVSLGSGRVVQEIMNPPLVVKSNTQDKVVSPPVDSSTPALSSTTPSVPIPASVDLVNSKCASYRTMALDSWDLCRK